MRIERIIFFLTFFLYIFNLNATTIVVGTGTNSNTTTTYPAPYGNFFFGAKHQFLITAAELNTAGMTAGNINDLSFVELICNCIHLLSI